MIYKRRKSGQGLVEYALILGLMTLLVLSALTFMSSGIQESYFETIPRAISDAIPGLAGSGS
jgi:Flp pilus assembly pilin Flp